LCYAAMVAGHANPIIVQAIKEQAEHGTLFGMPTTLASDLAEEIIRRYAGVIEMVRFTQSGVEATQTAIRLARAATGRKTIVKIEGQYHGGTDHLLVSIGRPPADLVTLAKAIGGGVPVGAFGGKRELMEQVTPLGPMVHFGTYNANPLGMAAGLACLTKVMTDDAYKEMTRLCTRLTDGMREVFGERNV